MHRRAVVLGGDFKIKQRRTLKSASFYPPVGGEAEHRIIAKAQIMSFGLTAGPSQC
jgi:hypothetical protein